MTQISRDDVRRLAQLSSVTLSDNELDSLEGDLVKILDYISQLNELDTTNVEPTYQVGERENVWREDTVIDETIGREQLLALSPETHDQQIKVPKVL